MSVATEPSPLEVAEVPITDAPPAHIPALDGLRGLAILAVVGSHYAPAIFDRGLPVQSEALSISDMGRHGVDLFFALSGFLITGILLDSRGSPSYFRTFYARRSLRIFPLYYFYVYIILVPFSQLEAVHAFGPIGAVAHDETWRYLSYLSNFGPDLGARNPVLGHLWSLAVEEQFYLVWPFVVFLLPRRWLALACLAGVAGSAFFRIGAVSGGSYWLESVYRSTFARADGLLMGALVALACRDPRWRPIARRASVPIGFGSALALAAIIAYTGGFDLQRRLPMTAGFSLIVLISSSVVARVVTASPDGGVLTWRPLRVLGKYSYGLYVWHLLPARIASPYLEGLGMPGRLGVMAILLAAVAVLVWASWAWLESPMLSLKRHYRYEAPPAALGAELV